MTGETRSEHDLLGEVAVPAQSLHGAHTERALENFPLAGEPVHGELARAFGAVKLACALTNRALGVWSGDDAKADAIERACRELADGRLAAEIVVDRLQGGAGTSTNMNVNEVLANRALQILGEAPGSYERVSPADDINLHQSTNDTYPDGAAPGRHRAAAQAGGAGGRPAGGVPGQGAGVRARGQGRDARSTRTPCSPPSAARWAPTPRP